MANSLTASSPTLWSKVSAYKLYKSGVFKNLASFDRKEALSYGAIIERPYRADLVAEDYSKGGMSSTDIQDLTTTSNTISIDQMDTIWFKVDDVDKKQNISDLMTENAGEAGIRLALRADAKFLYEVKNQVASLDDGDVSGTSGNGISLSVNNIDDVMSYVNQKMDEANVPQEERAMVISPFMRRVLDVRHSQKASGLGDKTTEYGSIGKVFGIKLYQSNQLTCSARWTPADHPSDAQTISIQGITFTFRTTIGVVAGSVLRGTSVAVTLDALIALINAGGVTSDVGVSNVSLSKANQRAVQMWLAVDGTTYMDIYVKGANSLTLTTSVAADAWTRHTQHNFAMRPKKSVDMVMQLNPSAEKQRGIVNGFMGDYFQLLQLYGIKSFYQGTYEGVNVKIDETLV